MPRAAEGIGTWETFDVGTARTEYWESVPILVYILDRKEELKELTVRVLSGFARQNHNLRILRIHVSSEDDLVFLHTLEVSEDEFQGLKADQGILVDFSNFPGKIIGLLEKCIESRAQETPRFQAVLTISGGESKFQIVETNDFNKLPHITLRFRPGNDPAVKQFLAFRLSEVKADCGRLEEDLKTAKRRSDALHLELAETKERLEKVELCRQQELLQAAANEKCTRVTLQEESTREKTRLKDQLDKERSELEARLHKELQALKLRNDTLDDENRELRLAQHEQNARVSDLERRLAMAEEQRISFQDESEKLRAENQCLHNDKHELELKVNEGRVSGRGLEEQVARFKESIDQRQARIDSLESSKAYLESRCEDMKQNMAKAEERAKDIEMEKRKADKIIEKFAMDLRASKEKTKRKLAVAMCQEEQMNQLRDRLYQLEHEKELLLSDFNKARSEVSHLESINKELKERLSMCQTKLEESSRMTHWLNTKVTDRQLLANSSRFHSFQPTAQLPPPSTYPLQSTHSQRHSPYQSSHKLFGS